MNLLEILKLYGLPTVAAVVLYVDLRIERTNNHAVEIQTVQAIQGINQTLSHILKELERN